MGAAVPEMVQEAAAQPEGALLAAYANFDLWITPAGDVCASSDQGEASPAPYRLDGNEVRLALDLLDREKTNPQLIESLGGRLYDALFPLPILAHLERTRAASPEHRVRLRLRFDAPEVAALPWELMHDGRKFLGLDPETSIVRYTQVDEPLQSLAVDGPLRVLITIASPASFPEIKRDELLLSLKAIFSQSQIEGRFEVQFLEHATYAGLLRLLRSGEYHVLHFFGYSGTGSTTGQPVLLFEDETGAARRLTADDLAALLYQEDRGRLLKHAQSLRLVVINDIESVAGTAGNRSCEVAKTLLLNGVPGAIAMQHSLPVSTSLKFVTELYAAIAGGLPVDVAAVKGRGAIAADTSGDQTPAAGQVAAGEWAAPVLFLHASDAQLYQPHRAQDLAFLASSAEVYRRIDQFKVQTNDPLTRFVLGHLRAFIMLGVLLLAGYWFASSQPDIMFISGILVVLAAVWLLSTLFQRKLPNTLNALWRQRIIRPRGQASLAHEYLAFLDEYNALLNHPRYVWAGRALGLAIAVFLLADFKPVANLPPTWDIPLHALLLLFYAPAGWMIGTLLWKMIATVTVTTRLSYRFDLDILPAHPDGCGGLKLLGDLYFEHVKIVLLAGLYVAAWVVLLTLANAAVERHVRLNHATEMPLLANPLALCALPAPGATGPASALPQGRATRFCACLNAQPPTELQAVRQQALRCLETTGEARAPFLIVAADAALEFYRWLWFYVGLLGFLAIIAIITFVLPMYNTHRIMQRKGDYYRSMAYSFAGEIADLERYAEGRVAASVSTGLEVSQQLEWLRARYQQYVNPPMWPFDARVRFRLLGSLATMIFSWLLSEIMPALIGSIQP